MDIFDLAQYCLSLACELSLGSEGNEEEVRKILLVNPSLANVKNDDVLFLLSPPLGFILTLALFPRFQFLRSRAILPCTLLLVHIIGRSFLSTYLSSSHFS